MEAPKTFWGWATLIYLIMLPITLLSKIGRKK
jgi:hypothetical protein